MLLACGGASGDGTYVQPDDSGQVDGKSLYTKKCVVCHGPAGKRGISGATDLSTSVLNMEATIAVISKGRNTMVGWEGVLTKQEIEALAEHVTSLRTAQ